jgi:hypothetical protein
VWPRGGGKNPVCVWLVASRSAPKLARAMLKNGLQGGRMYPGIPLGILGYPKVSRGAFGCHGYCWVSQCASGYPGGPGGGFGPKQEDAKRAAASASSGFLGGARVRR